MNFKASLLVVACTPSPHGMLFAGEFLKSFKRRRGGIGLWSQPFGFFLFPLFAFLMR